MNTGYGTNTERGERRRGIKKLVAATATALVLGVALASPSLGAVNGANRNLEVDYSLDFVLLEGYPADTAMRVDVMRGPSNVVIGSTTQRTDAAGLMEINHVGGGAFPNGDCWGPGSLDQNAPNVTPDILPGDKVQVTNTANTNDVDFTFVRRLFFNETGGAVVGDARGVETAPGVFDANAPITGLVAEGEEFIEARREPAGIREFVFPDANGDFNQPLGGNGGDVTLQYVKPSAGAGAVESTVAGPDGTVGGPATLECPAFARTAMTSVSPGVVNQTTVNSPMTVGGVVQDNATVDSVAIGSKTYTVNSANGTWTATIPAADLQALPQGNFDIVATFGGAAPPPAQTRTILKDTVAPVITASPGPGTYDDRKLVALRSNGQEQIRYSTDGNPPNSNSRVYNGTPIPVNFSQTIRAFSIDGAGNRRDASFAYVIRKASSISLNMSSGTMQLGQRKLISGVVRPAHSGRVTLTIKKPGADVVKNLTLRNSRFSFNYKPPVVGAYSVNVRFSGDADHKPSTATRSFRVIR